MPTTMVKKGAVMEGKPSAIQLEVANAQRQLTFPSIALQAWPLRFRAQRNYHFGSSVTRTSIYLKHPIGFLLNLSQR